MTEQEKAQAAADDSDEEAAPPSPVKVDKKKKKKRSDSESDTDFQVDSDQDTEVEPDVPEGDVQKELAEPGQQPIPGGPTHQFPAHSKNEGQLRLPGQSVVAPAQSSPVKPPKKKERSSGKPLSSPTVKISSVNQATKKEPNLPAVISLLSPSPSPELTATPPVKPFVRANIPIRSPFEPTHLTHNNHFCPACLKHHPSGACELKAAGVEHCGLCGLAHYGQGRTCPHIRSETQVREMLQALKNSPEKKELIDLAIKYLRGVKGALVQQKKRDREKAAGLHQNMTATNSAVAAATGLSHQLPVGGGPLPAPLDEASVLPTSNLNSYPLHGQAQARSRPHAAPQQQQRSYPQLQGGRAVHTLPEHANGHFVEQDVVDALRGFLGRE